MSYATCTYNPFLIRWDLIPPWPRPFKENEEIANPGLAEVKAAGNKESPYLRGILKSDKVLEDFLESAEPFKDPPAINLVETPKPGKVRKSGILDGNLYGLEMDEPEKLPHRKLYVPAARQFRSDGRPTFNPHMLDNTRRPHTQNGVIMIDPAEILKNSTRLGNEMWNNGHVHTDNYNGPLPYDQAALITSLAIDTERATL
jgi:hypothetical protein